MLSVTINMTRSNITINGVVPDLLQELESLGISIKHLDELNDCKELYNLTDNLKQEFMNEMREMEEEGLFVNPGAG